MMPDCAKHLLLLYKIFSSSTLPGDLVPFSITQKSPDQILDTIVSAHFFYFNPRNSGCVNTRYFSGRNKKIYDEACLISDKSIILFNMLSKLFFFLSKKYAQILMKTCAEKFKMLCLAIKIRRDHEVCKKLTP